MGDKYLWKISGQGYYGNKNWTGSVWTPVFDSVAIRAVSLLNPDCIGSQWSHGFFVVVVVSSWRPWVIGNRTVSQVQGNSSCSNHVADKPGSVAKSGAHLFPSHITCCSDG